jgi:hypothetical protein
MAEAAYKSPMLPLEKARWRLAAVWFIGAGIIAIILALQSLFDVYGSRVQEVFGWLLPNVVPTLSLMMGVFAAVALVQDAETDAMEVRTPFFWLALGLSTFHLICLLLVICVQPLLPSHTLSNGEPDTMRSFVVSNLFLGPLQGLVAAALGALFFSKSARKADAATPPQEQPGAATPITPAQPA